ncbi:MAG: glycosyltransferase family 2 protein [Candidatus Bathyarchaeia archaeon]
MPQLPKVVIMILNHNGLRWLPKCLSSLNQTNYPNYEIYLIDNASTDESCEYVMKNFPLVKVIHYRENLGFAEAYSRAIEKVNADHFLLLNNDTEILNSEWLRSLVNAMSEPDVAAVTCKMVSMVDHSILDSVGGMGIPFWRGFVDIGKCEVDDRQYDLGDFGGAGPFSFCGGAALISKSAFRIVGGFDRKLFMYFEDVDLSWRFRLRGYKIGYSPEATVAHFRRGSAERNTLDEFYFCHRNLLRAIVKNCGGTLRWALFNYLLYSFIMISTGFFITSRRSIPEKVLCGAIWNLRNFKNTYKQRLSIQTTRRLQDTEIIEAMFPKFPRYQPVRDWMTRVLNTIFESSQTRDFDRSRRIVKPTNERQ